MKYQFTVFTYDADQKVLSHNGTAVEMPKKCHELLLFLLRTPNRLVNRDELIDHVWQGRVVTNNTIDQCILKLRKALNQAHEGEYIESVYGQGIRFLPAIKLQNPATSTATKSHDQMRWMGVFLLVLVLAVGYWLFSSPQPEVAQTPENNISLQQNIPTSQAKKTAKDDWLLDGGRSYLSYLLHLYPNLNLQKTDRKTASGAQKPQIILDLIEADQSTMRVQVDLYQQPTAENGINSYHADLSLAKNNMKLAQTQITANQLTLLFPQIATWVAQYDGAETPQQVNDPNVFTENEQALLNYFKGLTEQISGNNGQALDYFNTAADLDPDFKLAWYEMAIALRKQGDPKKAISVLNAIVSNDQWLAFRVAVAKGITYNILEDPNAANASYEMALQSAQATNNLDGMAAIYINQAILYSDMNLNEQAEQRLLLAIELTDMASQPRRYGSIMNTYAKVATSMNNLPLAVEKSQLAIEAYQISGHVRYEMHAKSRLAGLLILSNEFNQAEGLVKESLSYAEQLKNLAALSSNHTKLATIYQSTGRFALAIEQWQTAIDINAKLELYDHTADAYLWLLKLYLHENNTAQAEVVIKMLMQLHKEHPLDEINQVLLEAELNMALFKQDTAASQQLLDALIASEHVLSQLYQGDVARLKQQPAAAEMYYLEALLAANSQGHFNQMVLVMNRLNALYLTYNRQKLVENLRRTGRLKPFIYPFQKYQALAAKSAGNHIKALSLMEELKLKAGDYWQSQDQLLLETMELDVK